MLDIFYLKLRTNHFPYLCQDPNCSDSIFFTNNKITKLILDFLQQFKIYRTIVELLDIIFRYKESYH